ncbi:MAG: hybrid sensor histidine kinase/response regulator [Myxococcales bacterium]|nr:hybrid sensor histidine kinase/response regulator [Myxococcales bacterium]
MNARVLLLEDEADDGLLLRVLLERAGHAVHAVALDAPRDALPATDLVVADTRRRGEDGARLAEALRTAVGDRGLVLVGAGPEARWLEAGADAWVAKPVRGAALSAGLARALAAGDARREAERRAVDDALARARAERDWLRSLVHDLNNPLTAVGAGLQLLSIDPLTPRQSEAARQARLAVGRLNRLVEGMLDLGRVGQGGALRLDRGPIGVAPLLDEVRAAVEPVAALKRVAVEAIVGADVPTLSVDGALVARALTNLADNAVRHTPRHTRVTLAAERAGDAVVLSVRDEGAGVPLELQARLFRPFHQASDSRVRGAAGLGLAWARAVAVAHGGDVEHRAPPAGGAEFRLRLPLPR